MGAILTDANGTVMINRDAANSDISRIDSAMTVLKQSQEAVTKLRSGASLMQGQTASAIDSQCQRLEKQISSLLANLTATKQLISQTVQKYEEMDAPLARNISSGSGM